jgi:hypothetical protein
MLEAAANSSYCLFHKFHKMADQLGPTLSKAVKSYAARMLALGATKSSALENKDHVFLRRLNEVIREMQRSRPHEPLSALWNDVEQALRTNSSIEFEEVEHLLFHGHLGHNAPNAPQYNAPNAPQDNTSTYRYRRLNKNEFRLLVLYPSKNYSSKIECNICHERLRRDLPYEALSYVWGDPTITRPISVGSGTFLATENLERALRALRNRTEMRILWVDALCINQKDNEEKSVQIQLMAKIYSLAPQVVVWLGKETNTSSKVFELFKAMIAPYREAGRNSNLPLTWLCENCSISHDTQTLAGRQHWWNTWFQFFMTWENQDAVEALQKFLQRAWWKRIWVFQEVVVATSALMMCGQTTMSWSDFHQAAGMGAYLCRTAATRLEERLVESHFGSSVRVRYNLLNGIEKLVEPILMMQVYREKRSKRRPVGFEALLRCTVEYISTDPRDKVYALLGLVNDDPAIHEKIVPRYDIRTDVLYRIVAKYIIKDRGSFVVLEDEFDNNGGCAKNGVVCLESWVPDFTRWHDPLPINRDPFLPEHYELRAANINLLKGSVTNRMPEPRSFDAGNRITSLPIALSTDLTVMAVFGYTVDSVSITSQPCLRTLNLDLLEQRLGQWQSCFYSQMTLNDKTFTEFLHSSKNDEFWFTVFGGRSNTRTDAYAQVESAVGRFDPFPPRTMEGNLRLRWEVAKLIKIVIVICADRKMFWTSSGLVGLGPQTLIEGDVVAVLCGARIPICLRKIKGKGNKWRVLGDWYVVSPDFL